jgi:hypothetical protein
MLALRSLFDWLLCPSSSHRVNICKLIQLLLAPNLFLPRDGGNGLLQVHCAHLRGLGGQGRVGDAETSSADGSPRPRAAGVHPDGAGDDAVRKVEVHHSAALFQVRVKLRFQRNDTRRKCQVPNSQLA